MKKSKSWIHICVHFLLLLTLAIHSYSQGVSPVTDDIAKLYTLKHNIPKDYKIPVYYIPKQESGMCWVKLNVFYLEGSLNDLMRKFGNVSSNREDLRLFTVMLEDLRYKMDSLETVMYEFSCHYRKELWPTEQYFDFIKEYLAAAKKGENPENCIPPPCPTTLSPVTTEFYREASQWNTPAVEDVDCLNGCTARKETRLLSEVVERSLFSLLFIPLLALAFLFVWKVRSRRIGEDIEEDPGEGGLFTGAEGAPPPQEVETPEKTHLNVCEAV